jgi:hypothetical protein
MSATQSSDPRLNNLKPWPKGKSGNPGGLSKKVRAFRRDCEKLLPKAAQRLEKLLDSDDPEDFKFALEWLRKAFIPTPKEAPADAKGATSTAASIPAALAARLAGMQ